MAKAVKKKATAPAGTVTKVKGDVSPQILLHQLILRNIDRSQKDVGEWRLAHRMAEAVINPTRRRLYDLFEDVVLDGHLSGIWKKRVSGVVNKKLFASRNGEKDESFESLFKSKRFRQLRKKLMQLHSHGIVGVEFLPGEKFDFKEIPRKHIRPHIGRITIEQDGETGFEYANEPMLWVLGNEEDPFGFLLKASPYALFKKGNYADWAQYVEIFGQPVIITKYNSYDEKTRVLLTQALEEAGSSLRLMLPKESEFEMMDGKTSNGDGKLQETFKNSLNAELSILVLGNTETTSNENGGSYAKGKVHAEQQLEITKDDMEEEILLLNDAHFLNVLKLYGYNTDGIEFQYETEVDNDKLSADLAIDEKLEKLGVPLGHDYYYEKYHRPKPENYDEMMAEREAIKNAITKTDDEDDDDDSDDGAGKPAPVPGDDNPANNNAGKKNKKPAKKEESVKAALRSMTFIQKLKALFSEAP